ncbi:hypothetical protein VNO77_15368 [Canavalia gladiata]|uniref:Uncharacterized protein n=1 Tax=Canavalia gladiata TaxID=3824 RepID=A0AAN9LZG6_CANGL
MSGNGLHLCRAPARRTFLVPSAFPPGTDPNIMKTEVVKRDTEEASQSKRKLEFAILRHYIEFVDLNR